MTRRFVDIALSAAGLIISAPLLLVAAIAIRIESEGSPLYRQQRVGLDGELFDMLKLRTMVAGAERIGAGLAVNEGDWRPTIPAQVAQYSDRQRGRLTVKPGITGWAQVNGRASLSWADRIELDLHYIEHRSLALDLGILWRTVAMVVGGSGLYKGASGGWEPEA